jgi:AmiR/NasT family two-component response regulator
METTAVVDCQSSGHPVLLARLDRLSARIGRSPEIEEAKSVLAGRYGITRGEAFAILRSVSSHSNRKLRDVAAELVTEVPEGERATLNRSG